MDDWSGDTSARGGTTATRFALYRRARDAAIRAENAAVARFGRKDHATPGALVKIGAGVGWHLLDRTPAAARASEL